jgi:hypothetical protein
MAEEVEDVVIEVVWEHSTKLVHKMHANPEMTLKEVHDELSKAHPELDDFYYVFHGKPIFNEFYGVFKARHLSPVLVLRQGTVDLQHQEAAQ